MELYWDMSELIFVVAPEISELTLIVCVPVESAVTDNPVIPVVAESSVLLVLVIDPPPLTLKTAFVPECRLLPAPIIPVADRNPAPVSLANMLMLPVVLLVRLKRSVVAS